MAENTSELPIDDSDVFCTVFIGDVGVGKSSLIKALLHENESKVPFCGKRGAGVTKEFTPYRLKDQRHYKMYGIDCVGVGDHSMGMTGIIAGLEKIVFPIHAVCILNSVPNGRVGLAAQVAAKIINLGMVKEYGDVAVSERVVIVGTKADMCDEEDAEDWKQQVAPCFKEFLGFLPKYMVTTGINVRNKPTKSTNVSQLLNALVDIGNQRPIKMNKVDTNEFVGFLQDCAGFDLGNPEEVKAMLSTLEQQRDEAMARFEAEKAKWEHELRKLTHENARTRGEVQQLRDENVIWKKQLDTQQKEWNVMEAQLQRQINDKLRQLDDLKTQTKNNKETSFARIEALQEEIRTEKRVNMDCAPYANNSIIVSGRRGVNACINAIYDWQNELYNGRPCFESRFTYRAKEGKKTVTKKVHLYWHSGEKVWVIGTLNEGCLAQVAHDVGHPMKIARPWTVLVGKRFKTDSTIHLDVYKPSSAASMGTFGALSGAAAGMTFGPIGAVVGGVVGAAFGYQVGS